MKIKPAPCKSSSNDFPKAEALKKSKKRKPRQKVIRRRFTMPESEYGMIAILQKKLIAAGVAVKKNDLLRAGIKKLSELSQTNLNKKLSKLYLNI
jgi:hypothetical protein